MLQRQGPLFPFHQIEEGKREGDGGENACRALVSLESSWCNRINSREGPIMAHLAAMIGCHRQRSQVKFLLQSGSGYLVSSLLDLGRAIFEIDSWRLFSYGVHKEEGEGARQLDALMIQSSSWSLELSRRIPQRGCDIITFLCVLQDFVFGELLSRSVLWGFILFFLQKHGDRWCKIACSGDLAWMKMDDDLWVTSSDGSLCVNQYQRSVNGGRIDS